MREADGMDSIRGIHVILLYSVSSDIKKSAKSIMICF